MDEYLATRRDAILATSHARLAAEFPDLPTDQLVAPVIEFLDIVIAALRANVSTGPDAERFVEGLGRATGTRDAHANLPMGILAREFGSLSDSFGTVASAEGAAFVAHEYHTLNLCTDAAIAAAIDAYHEIACADRGPEAAQRLGSFAHELRNAIASAQIAFQVLRKGQVGLNGRTGDILARNLGRLASLVERTLFLTRMQGHAPLDRRVLAVEDLVRDAVADAELERGVRVHTAVERGLGVEVDPMLIASAIGNLVQNGIRYSRPGGQVTVHAHRIEGGVAISVEDECGGLAPGAEQEMFTPFVRGKHDDKKGTGLGLAIVREAVEAHGGEVTVENRPGVGCVFTLRLPVPAPAPR
jgi:signal transduction histidine kinase